MNPQTLDLLKRVLKTFVQTFLASWAVSGFAFDRVLLTGAVAAAIAAVWNIILPTPVANK